ncbi:MAG: glycosyltransferase family 4 protein [Phycisphaerae bacterium]
MAKSRVLRDKSSVAFVGSYVPRQCGIATFTHDLTDAVSLQAADSGDVFTVAMNDQPEGYAYPDRVRFEIRQPVQTDYRLAAEFLNIQQVSAVCIQHEYGIYGGACGSHLLTMLRRLRRPLVTTLHTVLQDPDEQQHLVMQEVTRLSDRIVVMAEKARDILHDVWSVPSEKVVLIPHGIHDVPFVDPNYYKDQFGVEGRKVVLTFGLLSPGKGIEYAIDALAKAAKKFPDIVYIILGATHPHIKRTSGEEYRNSLTRRVHELGLSDNVMFVNRFVELSELKEYLGAADLYVTPYLNLEQITSGTLAYALGAGKATISTPYWHAQELLDDGRGRLVPAEDSDAIAEHITDLLENETQRHAMRKAAYTYCRRMTWARVAQDYLDLFDEASEAWVERQHTAVAVPHVKKSDQRNELPEVDLRHLKILTDDTGIVRNCVYSTPDRQQGYHTDEAGTALIACAMHWDQNHDETVVPLMHTYLSFLAHSFDPKSRRFRNRMDYNRQWADGFGSEDNHARALWGLGVAAALCPHESMIALATRLFLDGLPAMEDFSSPRAWAYAVVGIHAYLRRFGGDTEARRYRALLSEKIFNVFESNMTDDWPWFEDVVTYANAKLPHALLMSGKWMNRDDMIDVGKKALDWLIDIQTNEDGMLSIVGTDGWYMRGGRKAIFDQKPSEAQALVDACIEAYHVTREDHWVDKAYLAFNWFLGDNDMRTPLYDFTTGGCRDGLSQDRVVENQGAEATIAWLTSLLLMHEHQMEQALGKLPSDEAIRRRRVSRPIRPSGPVVGAKGKSNARPDSDGE